MPTPASHPHVTHPQHLQPQTRRHPLLELNGRLADWMAGHVLASLAMFDLALVLPLLTLPAPTSVKITLGVISGSWIQWWALPALQRTGNQASSKQDAQADAHHQALTYLAHSTDSILDKVREDTPGGIRTILDRLDRVESRLGRPRHGDIEHGVTTSSDPANGW